MAETLLGHHLYMIARLQVQTLTLSREQQCPINFTSSHTVPLVQLEVHSENPWQLSCEQHDYSLLGVGWGVLMLYFAQHNIKNAPQFL